MSENTSIQIKKSTKKVLDSLKISKRQSYNDVIEDLIEDSMELSEETLKEIELSREEYKQGKYHTWEEAKKKLGV